MKLFDVLNDLSDEQLEALKQSLRMLIETSTGDHHAKLSASLMDVLEAQWRRKLSVGG